MPVASLEMHDLSFGYPTSTEPVLRGVDLHLSAGWTGVIGPNGCGKTTLLQVAVGRLRPWAGRVVGPGGGVHCPQRTDDPPADLAAMLADYDGGARALVARLGVADDWPARWPTLSHGERKRAQIAAALWRRPNLLAIDEPTNHIDADARDMLIDALRGFSGVGLLVSHDRAMLDRLCERCVAFEAGRWTVRPGGYTAARQLAEADADQARAARAKAKREVARLNRAAADRREKASRSHRDRSKRGLSRRDHDARFRKNQARVTGKDGQAGRELRQMSGRVDQATRTLAETRAPKRSKLGIWVDGEPCRQDTLLRCEPMSVTVGRAELRVPELVVRPNDRIALTGRNGAGKSTLLAALRPRWTVEPDRCVDLAQEIDAAASAAIVDQVRRLPGATLGHVMKTVACLGSDVGRILETAQPSPGETRKLLLAMGIARRPHLIVMDEPTNHMDLPSVECLEAALAECRCAILLVSHDRRFLEALTTICWHIEDDQRGGRVLHAAGRDR